MKKLFPLLILSIVFILAGCTLTDFLTPCPEPLPDPVPTMEANVDAILTVEEVLWTIENIGEKNIFKYEITFDVFYPMLVKDNILLYVTGYALGIGEKHEGLLELLPYDSPESVSVTWELFD